MRSRMLVRMLDGKSYIESSEKKGISYLVGEPQANTSAQFTTSLPVYQSCEPTIL